MTPTSLAGSTLAIALATPTAETEAGFTALTYTQVLGVKVVGELGTQYKTNTNNAIGLVRPYQQMTGLAELSLDVELIKVADAGQNLLRAAVGISPGYSYRMQRRDGSAIYFQAEINSLMNGGFSPQSIAEQKCTMAVRGMVVEVG